MAGHIRAGVMSLLAGLAVLAGCAPSSVTPAAPPHPAARRAPEPPMSEPAEYDVDHVSRGAGETIFSRTGIGDPYRTGLPYPIFLALLRAYPQTFGATTEELSARFGFLARRADPASEDPDVRAGLPVGMHLTIDPITTVPFVVTSCALCHAERVHWPGGEATIIGLGSKHVRIHDYDDAFTKIASDHGLTVERIAHAARDAAAERGIKWPADYADVLVSGTIAALKARAEQRGELAERTVGGLPGRVATLEAFVPALRELSHRPVSFAEHVGWAKVPDVIGFRHRTTLSWDGTGEGPMSLLLVEADIAAGARVAWLERHPLQGAALDAYLKQPSPRPAFPRSLDRAAVERGRSLFEQHCADCHGTYGPTGDAIEYDEEVVALADIGTDPARASAATDDFERAADDRAVTRGYTRFRRTFGYVPPVLTNVWMRAPYGHAGQWPSLAVLATPPDKRPVSFVVALDAPYDLQDVGVATHATGGALAPGEYVYDASRPGFSVGGHPFLADLGPDARLVIAYLESL